MKSSLVSLLCLVAVQVGCSPAPREETPSPGSGGQSVGTGGTGGAADPVGSGGMGTPDVMPPAPEDAAMAADIKPVTDAPPSVDMQQPQPTDGGLSSKDFVCSWVVGITTTGEWYRAGFESVVDNARWQVTPIEMGHLEKWADPQHSIWNSGIQSPCASNSRTPDRIVFMATKYEWTTVAQFVPAYVGFVNSVKTKYPSVKRIDLMTYGRAPGNVECRGANRPSYSYIKAAQDEAAAMIPAMFPGFVFVTPKWEHKSCSDFGLCPHVNGAANATLARTIGAYFLQN